MGTHAAATKVRHTLDDYLALDEPDGPHYELDEGELVVTPSTTFNHNRLRDELRARLGREVERRKLGVVTSETDFLLGPRTVRRPDVAVVLQGHFRPEYARKVPIPIPPDIAIEVVSEHDRSGALLRKVRQYLAAGTRSVWLFYPEQREAHRHAAAGAAETLTPGSRWSEPALLPGVSFPLARFLPRY
jgi:Uma2 family endonuclease